MRKHRELGAACAIVAAIAGAGFASGREIVTFFTCAGWASWLGIAAASALLGALTAMLLRLAARGGAASFSGIYRTAMGPECGEAVAVLHGLTMLLTLAVMLTAAGELGALALNLRYAYPLAMAATLATALALSGGGFRGLRRMGLALAPLLAVYYLALALDPRPAPRAFNALPAGDTITGNVLAAVLLGGLYAALNAAMSGGVLASFSGDGLSPRRLGACTGALLFALLAPANAALLRAGASVRRLALPGVVLAARWGAAGFWLSLLAMWACVVTTLAAALGSLRSQAMEYGLDPRLAVLLAILGGALLSAIGFAPLVRIGYPLLGWGCALSLLALIPFLKSDSDPG